MHTKPLDDLKAAVQIEFKRDTKKADAVCAFIDALPSKRNKMWQVRDAKAKLADVLRLARCGHPQLLHRSGDALPVMVLSLESAYEMTRAAYGQTLADAFADMQPVEGGLEVHERPAKEQFSLGRGIAVEKVEVVTARRNRSVDHLTQSR